MERQIQAALLLISITVFYFALIGVPVSLIMLINAPDLFHVLVFLIDLLVVCIYGLIMKLNPEYRKLVTDYFDSGMPLS